MFVELDDNTKKDNYLALEIKNLEDFTHKKYVFMYCNEYCAKPAPSPCAKCAIFTDRITGQGVFISKIFYSKSLLLVIFFKSFFIHISEAHLSR